MGYFLTYLAKIIGHPVLFLIVNDVMNLISIIILYLIIYVVSGFTIEANFIILGNTKISLKQSMYT